MGLSKDKTTRVKQLAFLHLDGGKPVTGLIDLKKTNLDDRRKPFHLWSVDMHKKESPKIPNSDAIVIAPHYGQAVDDYIVYMNKTNRLKMAIGYPVVQGTVVENLE